MDIACIRKEVDFKAVRSSGPGGQHANKTATKVELSLHIPSSKGLSDDEKIRVLDKLKNHINKELILVVTDESSRSQLKNREAAFDKLETLLEKALRKRKPRKKTKPGKRAKEDRLREKRIRGEKKSLRQKPDLD